MLSLGPSQATQYPANDPWAKTKKVRFGADGMLAVTPVHLFVRLSEILLKSGTEERDWKLCGGASSD